jgi:AcrR family transcriptional regulator
MRDGSRTRSSIRAAALRLFVERGVDGVSVRDIADASGVRPSTLYVHWPSKEAMVAQMFSEGYDAYGRRISAAAFGEHGFRRRLEAMIRAICRLHDEDRHLFQFLLLSQHACLARVAVANSPVEALHAEVALAVARGEAAGDPALLTAAVVGVVVQAATFHLYGSIGRSLGEAADDIVALCLRLFADA